MSLKRILVVYAGNPVENGGLNVAISLAIKHGAALTGVAALGPSHIEQGYQQYIDHGIREILSERENSALNAAEATFQAALTSAGFTGPSRFTSIGPECRARVADLAHGYDLVVYCDHPLEEDRAHLPQTVRELVLEAGGPVLFVPAKSTMQTIDAPALLAWDKQAKASRAIADALQLGLLDKGAVLVEIGTQAPSQDVATSEMLDRLSRHGVPARHEVISRVHGSIAQALVQTAQAQSLGMIVMGAFQHSPLREDILGGVTLDMMAEQYLPILFSH